MELIGELIFWLVFRPLIAAFQAMVGILYPATSPQLKMVQRAALVLLLYGFGSFAATGLMSMFDVSWTVFLLVIAGGMTALMTAGGLGWYVERRYPEQFDSPRPKPTDEPCDGLPLPDPFESERSHAGKV